MTCSTSGAATRGSLIKVLVGIATLHFVVDSFGAVFSMLKYLAGLDPAKAGMIATFAMILGQGLQPLFGIWADHGHQRRFVLFGASLVLVAMLLGPVGYAANELGPILTFSLLFGLLLTVRVGQAMFHPAAASLIGNNSGLRRTTMLSMFIAPGMVGFAVAQPFFYWIYIALEGQTQWGLIGGLLVVAAAALGCQPLATNQSRRIDVRLIAKQLRVIRGPLLALFIIQTTTAGIGMGVYFIMPEFLESRGQPPTLILGGGAFLWVIGSSIFMLPVGLLADRLGRHRVMLVTMVLAGVAYYVLVGLPLMSSPVFAVALLISGGLLGAINPVCVSIGQQMAPQHASVVSGLLMGLAWAVGGSSQWLVGWLSRFESLGFGGALAILGAAFMPALALTCWLCIGDRGAQEVE